MLWSRDLSVKGGLGKGQRKTMSASIICKGVYVQTEKQIMSVLILLLSLRISHKHVIIYVIIRRIIVSVDKV